jgi:hypothetical protein
VARGEGKFVDKILIEVCAIVGVIKFALLPVEILEKIYIIFVETRFLK